MEHHAIMNRGDSAQGIARIPRETAPEYHTQAGQHNLVGNPQLTPPGLTAEFRVLDRQAAVDIIDRCDNNAKALGRARWLKNTCAHGDQALVAKLANLMQGELYAVNGDAVVISVEGLLVRGRELLQAIITTNIRTVVLVVRGVPYDLATTSIDLARPRTPAQVLEALGAPVGWVAVDAVKFMFLEKHAWRGSLEHFRRFEIQEIYRANRDVESSLNYVCAAGPLDANSGLLAFGHWRFGKINPPLRDEFFEGFYKPEGLPATDVRFELREALKKYLPPLLQAELLVKAWNVARKFWPAVFIPLGYTAGKFPPIL